MKKIIIALLFTVFLSKASNATVAEAPDTLTYLQSIISNKANYIGKPFSTLLNDLQIQIKFFSPFASLHHDMTKETSTTFSFYFPQTADDLYLTFPKLKILWNPYLNANTSNYLYSKYNGGGWTQEVIDFYKTAVIKDMDILK